MREGPYPAVIFIQNTLLTRNGGPLRPDGLVGVKYNGVTRWCVSEFDGEGYDGAENARAVHFGMPVVRFSVKEIWDASFAELYWKRIHAALGIPADAWGGGGGGRSGGARAPTSGPCRAAFDARRGRRRARLQRQ